MIHKYELLLKHKYGSAVMGITVDTDDIAEVLEFASAHGAVAIRRLDRYSDYCLIRNDSEIWVKIPSAVYVDLCQRLVYS